MRDIKFRGKQRDGKWVYGDYSKSEYNYFIKSSAVIPETIGQYTGLKANGAMVYEGDIISYTWDNPENPYDPNIEIQPVFWENGCFYIGDESIEILLDDPEGYEVIGNIHDNPELLQS